MYQLPPDAFINNDSGWYIADPMLISAVAGVVSVIVAMAFMIVFDQTADTLLYCFVFEKKNGGSGNAPDALNVLIEDTKAKHQD